MKMISKDSASFRDPSGYVFSKNDKVYRWISPSYVPIYYKLMGSGLYDELVARRLLIPHREVILNDVPLNDGLIIQPKRVPFISYPYEWCFEQYKDAALTTLDIHLTALRHGMILKDASAYNIQFIDGYAVLMDTLSFEIYDEGTPWIAYGQFCRHFLAPLLLMCKVDVRISKIMQSYIDGIPLDMASNLLKGRGGGLFALMHIHFHARAISKYNNKGSEIKYRQMSRNSMIAFSESLRSNISRMKAGKIITEWEDYYLHTNYDDASADSKEKILREMIQGITPIKTAWDLGANNGRYSRVINEMGPYVVAFDVDENAVSYNWDRVKEKHEKMLPLILDLCAPSPAIGFGNQERKTIGERQKADLVTMLALIHHLAISDNLPFHKIAEWLSGLCKYLVIEFVPKEDSQVQKLLSTRKDVFPDYDENHFEKVFEGYFKLEKKKKIKNSIRILYLWKNESMD